MANPMDRRSSVTSQHSNTSAEPRDLRRTSASNSNPDVFSDDYAIDMPPVSDGFRPRSPRGTSNEPTSSPRPLSLPRPIGRRSVALQPSPSPGEDSSKRPRIVRSSTSGLEPRNSFSLRHDAQNSDMPRRIPSVASSVSFDVIRRPLSNISNTPNHPFTPFSQSTAQTRTLPASTARNSVRSPNGLHRPQHPYGMYPQGTVAETDALENSTDITNVGFPGLRQQYTRRLGPEGEEADDIIGPDGHTEQLPPYTRYPAAQDADPLPRKESFAPAPPADAGSSSSAEPPRTGVSDATAHDQLLPDGSRTPGAAPLTSPASSTVVGDSSDNEKWVDKSKKRTCGGKMPKWAVILLIVLAIVVAAVVGGVVGKIVGKQRSTAPPPTLSQDPDQALDGGSARVITTTLIDATPVTSAPPDLPTLPVGKYIFPMAPAISVRSACVQDLSQKQSWGCASGIPLNVDIDQDGSSTKVTLSSTPDAKPNYGPISPNMAGPAPIQLVIDTDQPDRGPAWFFQQPVNKTVILHENAINSSAVHKRGWQEIEHESELHRRSRTAAQPGEKPWLCFWNMTMLQGFIYVSVDANEELDLSLASSVATAAPTPDSPYGADLPSSTSTLATVASPAASPSTTAPAVLQKGKRAPGDDHDHNAYDGPPTSTSAAPETSTAAWPSGLPLPYPKAIKLEERRIPGISQPPYCQQMQVLYDGSLGNLPGPPVVHLQEREAPVQRRVVYNVQRHRPRISRRYDDDYCACVWVGQ